MLIDLFKVIELVIRRRFFAFFDRFVFIMFCGISSADCESFKNTDFFNLIGFLF